MLLRLLTSSSAASSSAWCAAAAGAAPLTSALLALWPSHPSLLHHPLHHQQQQQQQQEAPLGGRSYAATASAPSSAARPANAGPLPQHQPQQGQAQQQQGHVQQQQQQQQRSAATTACDIVQADHLVQKGPSGSPPVIVIKTAACPLENKRLGFIGSGQMAEALTRGLLSRELIDGSQVSCSDPNPQRMDVFKAFGASAYECNLEVVRNCDILFVAVKPEQVSKVLREVRPALTGSHTIVSIAAGITLGALSEAAGPNARVVRVMPNTPCLVGETAAAMCLGGRADASDESLVRCLFEAVGRIYTVDEKLLSAVTGLSGSGPAYVFMMIEALADGGVRAGLPRDIAQALAAQTVLGSAKMVLETGKHPGALKDMVTSPGGTTIAGVHELEKAGVRAAFIAAVYAGTVRADQLSQGPN